MPRRPAPRIPPQEGSASAGDARLRPSNNISLAGEFLVLAQLALRDLNGTLTLGNTKAVDILVLNPTTKRMFRVEVKTSGKGPEQEGIFGSNYAWLMSVRHAEFADDDLVYVFVSLPQIEDETLRPHFFLVPAAEVAAYVSWNHEHHLQHVGRRRNPESSMRKFRIPASVPNEETIPPAWRDGRWRKWEGNWKVFEQPAGG